MVAASKLRRAQVAAEAARPYATKMEAVISNIAAAAARSPSAQAWSAPAGTRFICFWCVRRARPFGAFNSAIVRPARERAQALMAQGKEVKFFCVGREGYEQLRRTFEKQIVEHVDLRGVRQLGFLNAEDIAKKVLVASMPANSMFAADLLDVQVGDRADPDRAAGHSTGRGRRGQRGSTAAYEYEPEEEEIMTRLLPRNLAMQISARCWKTTPPSMGRR